MKKPVLLISSLASILALASCSGLSISGSSTVTSSVVDDSEIGEEIALDKDAVKALSLSSITSIKGIGVLQEDPNTGSSSEGGSSSSETSTSESETGTSEDTSSSSSEEEVDEETEEELALVDKYYSLYKSFSNDSLLSITTYESTLEGYTYVAVIALNNGDSTTTDYSIFWNEEEIQEDELDEDEDEDAEDMEKDNDEEGNEKGYHHEDFEGGEEDDHGHQPNREDDGEVTTSSSQGDTSSSSEEEEESPYKFTRITGLLRSTDSEIAIKGIQFTNSEDSSYEWMIHGEDEENGVFTKAHTYSDPTNSYFSYLKINNREFEERLVVSSSVVDEVSYLSFTDETADSFSSYSFASRSDEYGNAAIYVTYSNDEDKGTMVILVLHDDTGAEVIEYVMGDGEHYHNDGHGHHHHGGF